MGLISNEGPATKSYQTELHGIESFECHLGSDRDFIGSTNVQASADPSQFNGNAILERKLESVGRPLLALRTPSPLKIRSHCQYSFHVGEVIRQCACRCHPLRVEDVSWGYCLQCIDRHGLQYISSGCILFESDLSHQSKFQSLLIECHLRLSRISIFTQLEQ